MSTFKKFKEWYKIAQPHKGYFAASFCGVMLAIIVEVIMAVPAANVITSLTNYDYNGAIFWLAIGIGCTFLCYLGWHINYRMYYKQCRYITLNLSSKLYDKISMATEDGLNNQSLEKLMNIFTANISSVETLTDYVCYLSCYIIRAFVTTFIVMFYNLTIGLIMLAVIILMYFWYLFLTKKVNKYTQTVYGERDHIGEKITDIVDGRAYNKKMNLQDVTKTQYLGQIKQVTKAYNSRGLINTIRKHWTYAVLYIIITALTIWLASLTNATKLPLTVYLVLAPYLINIIDYAKNGYELFYELERAGVSAKRIQTVLNMPTKDLVNFSTNTTDKLTQNLVFSNVSYLDTNQGKNKTGNLQPFNVDIAPKTITLFKGVQNCGKRSIFYILRRAISPTTGTITMDGINIYDFDKDTYKHNFNYATSKPYFYNESILDNLLFVCDSKSKIIKICKDLDIHNSIKALPDGYDTNIVKDKELFTPYLLFMIGLARAIASASEWLCIYEFPTTLTEKQQENILNKLQELKKSCSIIIFSASDNMSDICDNYFLVQAGKIKQLKKEQV